MRWRAIAELSIEITIATTNANMGAAPTPQDHGSDGVIFTVGAAGVHGQSQGGSAAIGYDVPRCALFCTVPAGGSGTSAGGARSCSIRAVGGARHEEVQGEKERSEGVDVWRRVAGAEEGLGLGGASHHKDAYYSLRWGEA